MISHSTTSKPADLAGQVVQRDGERSSSFKQGIWMMSFMAAEGSKLPSAP